MGLSTPLAPMWQPTTSPNCSMTLLRLKRLEVSAMPMISTAALIGCTSPGGLVAHPPPGSGCSGPPLGARIRAAGELHACSKDQNFTRVDVFGSLLGTETRRVSKWSRFVMPPALRWNVLPCNTSYQYTMRTATSLRSNSSERRCKGIRPKAKRNVATILMIHICTTAKMMFHSHRV